MTLIQIKNYKALDMPSLVRSVLKFIYERPKMKADEVTLMLDSIKIWTKHFNYKLQIGFSEIDEENQFVLHKLLTWLDMDSRGKFESRKELIRKHKIDYRKLAQHRLPEAYTKDDFVKAQAEKKVYDREHRQQEDRGMQSEN